MCTLTWTYQANNGGYQLHFNRDESRLRETALSPQIITTGDVEFLAPIDQTAQGTWILVNHWGFTVCLLNNYIDVKNTGGKRSRGLLVKDLCIAKDVAHALSILNGAGIEDYSPFDIYLFDKRRTYEVNWNGELRSDNPSPKSFKSSSAFNIEAVINGRADLLKSIEKTPESLRAFHQSHEPTKSAYSVCMHREDARTQSYTEICVNDSAASMRYTDGPPCSHPLSAAISLKLR